MRTGSAANTWSTGAELINVILYINAYLQTEFGPAKTWTWGNPQLISLMPWGTHNRHLICYIYHMCPLYHQSRACTCSQTGKQCTSAHVENVAQLAFLNHLYFCIRLHQCVRTTVGGKEKKTFLVEVWTERHPNYIQATCVQGQPEKSNVTAT